MGHLREQVVTRPLLFREVVWLVADNAGNLGRAIAVYGIIDFDGAGKYTLSGAQVMASDVGVPENLPATGTYSIAASGHGF